ncbi:MAG: peptidoglycan-binding protein [Clostridia bacterium]|nr:peptidoglycan-binding protein [Clostridia bacterium]
MKNAIDFIRFALSHAKSGSIPAGAQLPLDIEECGTAPWEYLPATAGEPITRELLDERWEHFYSRLGWTREQFDRMTADFPYLKTCAADSQGLLNCFLGAEATPHYCYNAWCTEKGEIARVKRSFAIGEAVFFRDEDGRAVHTGFVCGSVGGETLIVEARGLGTGVCVTKLSERPFTHRGLVTEQLHYGEDCVGEQLLLSIKKPLLRGEHIRRLQLALNQLGYFCGVPDGVCGELTMLGVKDFADAHFRMKRPLEKSASENKKRA